MSKTLLGFAAVIGCALLLMPLLVEVDQQQAARPAPTQQVVVARLP